MRLRPNTWDAQIVASVVTENEYGLPDTMAGMTVVDIGAHIGAFATACINRNAKKVICYEPDPENFELLTENMKELTSIRGGELEVQIINSAVVGSAGNFFLRRLSNHDQELGRNTGHVDVFGVDGLEVEAITITECLRSAGRVDYLKIDCEGSEWAVFMTGDFTGIGNIVGELHALPDSDHTSLRVFNAMSLSSLGETMRKRLDSQGFNVQILPLSTETSKLIAKSKSHVTVRDNKRPKLLWIGDAGVPTGYGRVTEVVCSGLVRLGWDVSVLGIGYNGDPHHQPYQIYPANGPGETGCINVRNTSLRLKPVMDKVKPDLALVQDDHWNVAIIIDAMAWMNSWVPTVGYVAVDSENIREDVSKYLNNLKHAICHTKYGIDQLNKAGYTGASSIAGHGVDTSRYAIYDKVQAREGIQTASGRTTKDAFIWGVVAVNQPRKRLDLTIAFFTAWWKHAGKPDNAYLYLHTSAKGTWDLRQLGEFHGIRERILSTSGETLPDLSLPTLYNAMDVMISTSEGESFGLTSLEAMACGIPQIAVNTGGLPYWAGDAIYWVEPSHYAFTQNQVNTKRYIASESDFIVAMDQMYNSRELREEYSKRGLELSKKLTWDSVIQHFHTTLSGVIANQRKAKAANTNALAEF